MNRLKIVINTSSEINGIEVRSETAIDLPTDKPLFILGRNGTGKSALIHEILVQCRGGVSGSMVYLPGSRLNHFEADSLSMTPVSRSQYELNIPSWDDSLQIRTKPTAGTFRNERAIYDLQVEELDYKLALMNKIVREGRTSLAVDVLETKMSPIERVNRLLLLANLPFQTIMHGIELRAQRDGSTISISSLSDGERNALVLIADVIAGRPGSLILIDEPELHMHRAIIVPLLSALIAERPDCRMVISTHELALASAYPDSPIILVRNCTWRDERPYAWAIDLLPDSESIPEDLRIDLLGSRQTILFIEGTSVSRDQPLYAILFPKVSLRHKSSCTDVRRAVVGLRDVEATHHARAFGLVDNDGMDDDFREELAREGVFSLPVFAVESLYYAPQVIAAVAKRQGETFGTDADALVANARARALSTLRQDGKVEYLASRVAERQMRDKFLGSMPSRQQMVSADNGLLQVSLASPYPPTRERLYSLLQTDDLDAIVAGFPIRSSGVLREISSSLLFQNEALYESAALAEIQRNLALAETLRSMLGNLAVHLA